ncbi:MAG TPA: DUF3788 family protein [Bryobacteraceae bacterium]|nr:DUF3788 family protein [Bryobacteraceae bacterium]
MLSKDELWNRLLADLASECGLTETEVHPKALRVKKGKRNIVYLVPGDKTFTAAFALGAKAVEEAKRLMNLDDAPKYPEGTAVRIIVKTLADVALVTKLAAIKMKN